jgi:L-malate glycosyltransferase
MVGRCSAQRHRVLVVCPYPVGVAPGQRLKYEQYFPALEVAGISVTVSPFMTRRFWDIAYKRGRVVEKVFWTLFGYFRRVGDLLRLRAYDVVYVFLWGTPFGPPLFEKLMVWLQPNIVFDIDDMVFLSHSSRANAWLVRLKGREKSLFLMERARHVITCSPHLTELAKAKNPAVTDISSTIDTDRYSPGVSHGTEDVVTLGWSGSHSTSRYLHLIEPALVQVASKFQVKFLVIGDETFRFRELECEAIAWNAVREVEDLRRITIGVYPLPDDDWVLGKSGLKALQYMALGIPVVATAIGANFRVIDDGVSGYLVHTENEWVDRLGTLIQDWELRRRMGAAGRRAVEERFSVGANAGTYVRIVREVTLTSARR